VNIFDIDDDDPPSSARSTAPKPPAREPPARDPVKAEESSTLIADPMKVILDVRKDIEKFQNGGSRKDLVEAFRDQFIATRHQAATKTEEVRMLALNALQARISNIQSTAELLKVNSVLSESSKNDLAMVLGAHPGQAPALINLQQVIGLEPNQRLALPEREDKTSNPIKDASQVIEAFEHLTRYIKAVSPRDPGKEENSDDAEDARPPLRLLRSDGRGSP
jgi:hypothetical protein